MRKRHEARIAYAFLAPSFVGVALFLVAPILAIFWLSLQHWDLLGDTRFVGLENFAAVFADERFWHSLGVTALFVAISLPLQVAIGLALGVVLARDAPGTRVAQVVLLLPWVSAPLTLGVVWRWIFAPDEGLLNTILGVRVEWLSEPALVLPAIIAVAVWSQIGYASLFFASGLRSIPPDLLAAAAIDGATGAQSFFRIRLPLIRPTFVFVLITGLIGSFQVFDLAYALAPGGGPDAAGDVIVARIYAAAFEQNAFGEASAMSIVLFAIVLVLAAVQQAYYRRRTTFEIA